VLPQDSGAARGLIWYYLQSGLRSSFGSAFSGHFRGDGFSSDPLTPSLVTCADNRTIPPPPPPPFGALPVGSHGASPVVRNLHSGLSPCFFGGFGSSGPFGDPRLGPKALSEHL
jgi:hypothetical protein